MEDRAMWSTVEMNDVQQTMSCLELHGAVFAACNCRKPPGQFAGYRLAARCGFPRVHVPSDRRLDGEHNARKIRATFENAGLQKCEFPRAQSIVERARYFPIILMGSVYRHSNPGHPLGHRSAPCVVQTRCTHPWPRRWRSIKVCSSSVHRCRRGYSPRRRRQIGRAHV